MALSRSEFFERLALSQTRLGLNADVSPARYAEWVKQGLAPAAERIQNKGIHPQYRYGAKHFRRALQLARLYSRDFRDRDAILIQLFLRGYGVETHEVREPLKKEVSKALAQLHAGQRSTYLVSAGDIPPASRDAISRRMGKQNEIFIQSGMGFDQDGLIDMWRLTGNERDTIRDVDPPERPNALFSVTHEAGWAVFMEALSGLFAIDEKSEWTIAKRVIQEASTDDFQAARMAAHQLFIQAGASGVIPGLPNISALSAGEISQRREGMAYSREWAAVSLALCLYLLQIGPAIAEQVVQSSGDGNA